MVDLIPEKLWYLTWVPAGIVPISCYPFDLSCLDAEPIGLGSGPSGEIYRVSHLVVQRCIELRRMDLRVGRFPEQYEKSCRGWQVLDGATVTGIHSERCSITECRVLKDREDGRFLIDSIFGLRTVEEGSLFTSEESAKESVIGLCPECAEKNKSKSRILGAWACLKPGLPV